MNFDWSKWGFWIGIIALAVTIGLWIYQTYFHNKKPKLSFIVQSNEELYTLKQNVADLNITYKGIDLKEGEKNISILILEMRNDGDVNFIESHYDKSTPFGFKLLDGKLIGKPEIVKSSNDSYFGSSIKNNSNDTVQLNYIQLDKNDFVEFKCIAIHDSKLKPSIQPLGKISGISEFNTTNLIPTSNKSNTNRMMWLTIITALMSLLLGTLNYYHKFKSKTIDTEDYPYAIRRTINQDELEERNRDIKSFHLKREKMDWSFYDAVIVTIQENGESVVTIDQAINLNDKAKSQNYIGSFHKDKLINEIVVSCKDLGLSHLYVYILHEDSIIDSRKVVLQVLDGAGYCQ